MAGTKHFNVLGQWVHTELVWMYINVSWWYRGGFILMTILIILVQESWRWRGAMGEGGVFASLSHSVLGFWKTQRLKLWPSGHFSPGELKVEGAPWREGGVHTWEIVSRWADGHRAPPVADILSRFWAVIWDLIYFVLDWLIYLMSGQIYHQSSGTLWLYAFTIDFTLD